MIDFNFFIITHNANDFVRTGHLVAFRHLFYILRLPQKSKKINLFIRKPFVRKSMK
ncbi:hypothetical protein Llc71_08210 [Lactococcus cremoris]|nr:hypothetical protein Llc71_08210 [Lactococcus cremoris]GEB08376.1 hypothetical protein LLA03_09610 [Lactococcus lactis subsp. lactis]